MGKHLASKYLENVGSFLREKNLASYSTVGSFLDLTAADQQGTEIHAITN